MIIIIVIIIVCVFFYSRGRKSVPTFSWDYSACVFFVVRSLVTAIGATS